jgi:hypothetical protein
VDAVEQVEISIKYYYEMNFDQILVSIDCEGYYEIVFMERPFESTTT